MTAQGSHDGVQGRAVPNKIRQPCRRVLDFPGDGGYIIENIDADADDGHVLRRAFHQYSRQFGFARQQVVRPAQAHGIQPHAAEHVEQGQPRNQGQMSPVHAGRCILRSGQGDGEGCPQAAFLPYPFAVEPAAASCLNAADGNMPRGEGSGQIIGGKSLGPFMISPVAAWSFLLRRGGK